MSRIEAESRAEARELSAAQPAAEVVDRSSGEIWIGAATLRPAAGCYLVFSDHDLDAVGAIRKLEAGGWSAWRHGEVIATTRTLSEAAEALVPQAN